MATLESTPEAILERYETEEFAPALDETEQASIQRYLAEQGMRAGISLLPFAGNEPMETEILLGSDPEAKRTLELSPGAKVGPYFLEGVYHPEGITVWVPGGETSE